VSHYVISGITKHFVSPFPSCTQRHVCQSNQILFGRLAGIAVSDFNLKFGNVG